MNHMGTSNNFAEGKSKRTYNIRRRKEEQTIFPFLESRLLESRDSSTPRRSHEGNFYCLCALEIRASGRKGIFSPDLVGVAQDREGSKQHIWLLST